MTSPSDNRHRLNRERVARHAQKQRDLGRVQRKRWAHPDDWPEIDRVISEMNEYRLKNAAPRADE